MYKENYKTPRGIFFEENMSAENPKIDRGTQLRVHHVLDGQVLPQETMEILGKKVGPEGDDRSYLAAYPGWRHIHEIPIEALNEGVYGCIIIDEIIPPSSGAKK